MGKIIPAIILIVSTCLVFSFIIPSSAAPDKKQAQEYRDQGYKAQRAGSLDTALSYYQKAVGMDPENAVAYNDIGVVLEAKSDYDRAKQAYLRALSLDPKFLSAYYNLAALFEKEGDTEQAAYYWKMRVQLGDWSDVWTWRAKENLDALQASGQLSGSGVPSQGSSSLSRGADPKRDAQFHLYQGKQYIASGDYVRALKELTRAYLLDQNNIEIGKLLEETERRVLLYK